MFCAEVIIMLEVLNKLTIHAPKDVYGSIKMVTDNNRVKNVLNATEHKINIFYSDGGKFLEFW